MVHTYCKSHVIIKSGIITIKCVIILHLPFSLDGRVSERGEEREREKDVRGKISGHKISTYMKIYHDW